MFGHILIKLLNLLFFYFLLFFFCLFGLIFRNIIIFTNICTVASYLFLISYSKFVKKKEEKEKTIAIAKLFALYANAKNLLSYYIRRW